MRTYHKYIEYNSKWHVGIWMYQHSDVQLLCSKSNYKQHGIYHPINSRHHYKDDLLTNSHDHPSCSPECEMCVGYFQHHGEQSPDMYMWDRQDSD